MNNFLIKTFFVWFVVGLQLNVNAEDWITEEVLKQLTEVRQELKQLKGEVVLLNKEVKNLSLPKNNPQDRVTSVEFGDLPRLGSAESTIAIVEFSEYQCPYCSRHFKQTMPLIKSNYLDTNKIQYIKRDFPLSFHHNAPGAAIAARCAAKQSNSAYWAMNTNLLENGNPGLNTENYKKVAENLRLNVEKFSSCLEDKTIARKVDEDMAYGQQIGVTGTPAFFIGKIQDNKIVQVKRLVGAQPYSSFSRAIDALLQ